MSFNTVARAANDTELQQRVQASVYSEAIGNPELADTNFARQVLSGYPPLTGLYWAVADAVEAAYEAGIAAGRGSPGYDTDVVTDGAITSAVVANWPADPVPPAVPLMEKPTYEQVLISRLSQRIGDLSVTMEAMQLQIESLGQALKDNGIDPETLQPVVDASGNGVPQVIGSNHD